MKFDLFPVVFLAAALAAAGCTNKDIEGPDESTSDNNAPPVADAGADLTVTAGDAVTLAGSGSDSDGSIASYSWSQASGPSVSLSADGAEAGFTAPAVEELAQLVFELRVTDDDGANSAADSVTVTVFPRQEKFFGTAVEQADDYTRLTVYFDQLTPGNAGKWGSVESTRDQMDWTALDTAHQFALDNGLRYKHHTLIWGQQQPAWMDDLSAEEQLAEIDEWMVALKNRYGGEIDMIDVVNEPLHAPPSYKEALGGDGETGWDWVITAFELARQHFPDSILILNDYNVLQLRESTEDYLEIIELLQARNLIDGIGVQSHFLEQTPAQEVQDNLDLLAATGLPIYASELDINFIDDARQANKMRELFSVFWQHPGVAGVTHWGYRQGHTWRTEAWLLNSDGTERPALSWLHCFIAGESDCDALVPEYVPAGWSGGASGVRLEAELHDRGQGVLASGDIVSHTDAGDWILFQGVEFQPEWDNFSVNYAKGSGATGSVSVRLDSLDNDNLARLELPPTDGWSEFQTAEAEWQPIEGTHDVYFRFNDTAGVGNIDWLRFAPAGAAVEVNLIEGEFEQGIGNWYAWAGGTLTSSDEQSRSGGRSLKASGFSGGGYAANEITALVEPGTSYPVSLWVWLSQAGQVTLTRELAGCEGTDQWSWLDNKADIPAQTWTQLSGELAIPEGCTPSKVQIYLENTADGIDVYLDDARVIAAAPAEPSDDLVADGGFEGSVVPSGWSTWWAGGTSLEVTGEQAQAGAQSLKVSNRTENSMPSYDLTSSVAAGASYQVNAWVHHTGPDAAPVSLTRKLACDGEDDSYDAVAQNNAVAAGTWTQLTGTLEIPAGCSMVETRLYFENTPLEVETLYIDEVSVTPM